MLTIILALWLANLVPAAESPLPTPWENPVPVWPHLVSEEEAQEQVRIAVKKIKDEHHAEAVMRCDARAAGLADALNASTAGDFDGLRAHGIQINPTEATALEDAPQNDRRDTCSVALTNNPASLVYDAEIDLTGSLDRYTLVYKVNEVQK